MENAQKLAFLILASTLLCQCAPFKPSDKRAGVCNELNKKIIFTGSASNPRGADLQTAESALVQKQYERDNCDQ